MEIEIRKERRRKATRKYTPSIGVDIKGFFVNMPTALRAFGFAAFLISVAGVSIFCTSILMNSGILDGIGKGNDPSPPNESIVAVKESSSKPTVGIISNKKGKPEYLFVPGRKEYEVTYEENGVLKTKTMSKDPTK
jgi:hypothetical protein